MTAPPPDDPDGPATRAVSVRGPWRRWCQIADEATDAWIVTRPEGAGWFLLHALAEDAAEPAEEVAAALTDILQRPHPCVARVYDVSEVRGALWWVTDLEPGEDLGRTLSRARHTRAPFSVTESVRRVRDLAAGLAHLRAGARRRARFDPLSARDATERMVITEGWRLRVKPFETVSSHSPVAPSLRLLAPEVIQGFAWEERADVWTLAQVLYESLFAERAFQGESDFEVLGAILGAATPPRLDAPGRCPPEIVDALRAALTRDPARRTPRIEELSRALEPFASAERGADAVYRTDPRAAIAAAAAAQDLPRAAALLVAAPTLLDRGFARFLWRALAAPLVDALRDGRCEEPEVVLLTAVRAVALPDLRALREDKATRLRSHALLDALLLDDARGSPSA